MSEHILLVDDEQNFRFSAELALKKQGYKVSETGDGEDAFTRILEAEKNSSQFDLILLDMDLPTLSGIEIIRRLQVMKIAVPTIIISGHLASNLFRFVTEFKALICSFIIEKHEFHQVVMEARPTILSERGTHAYQTAYPRDT